MNLFDLLKSAVGLANKAHDMHEVIVDLTGAELKKTSELDDLLDEEEKEKM